MPKFPPQDLFFRTAFQNQPEWYYYNKQTEKKRDTYTEEEKKAELRKFIGYTGYGIPCPHRSLWTNSTNEFNTVDMWTTF